jgi:hypothetical protein
VLGALLVVFPGRPAAAQGINRVGSAYPLWIATAAGCPVQLLDGTIVRKPQGSSPEQKIANIEYKAVYKNASTIPIRSVVLQWTASGTSGETVHTELTLVRGDRPLRPGRTASRTVLGAPPESEIDRYVVTISTVEFTDGSRWPREISPDSETVSETADVPTSTVPSVSPTEVPADRQADDPEKVNPQAPAQLGEHLLSNEAPSEIRGQVADGDLGSSAPLDSNDPSFSIETPSEIRARAAKGDPESQYRIGLEYVVGERVVQDYVEAHMWLNLAAARGHPDAKKQRDGLIERMAPEQIAEAQRRARKWKPRRW